MAELGSVTALLYRERFSHKPWLYFRDSATEATSHLYLPGPTSSCLERNAHYVLTSMNELWIFSGCGPVTARQFQLTGSPLPTSAVLVSSQNFGDSDSSAEGFIKLASGGLAGIWSQGIRPGEGLGFAYRSPSGDWSTIFQGGLITVSSVQTIAQHPVDGSIWAFSIADGNHRIIAVHLSESDSGLSVDWADMEYIAHPRDGINGPDGELPKGLFAIPDASRNAILLVYNSQPHELLSTSPLITASHITIAKISTDATKSFIHFPTNVERVERIGIVALPDKIWLLYRPIQPETFDCDDNYVVSYSDGSFSDPTFVGTSQWGGVHDPNEPCENLGTYEWTAMGASRAEFAKFFINTDPNISGDIHYLRVVEGTSPPSDTNPPTVSINSPANGATVSATVTVTAGASDNVGVTKVEFYIDSALQSTDTSSPYTFSWDTTEFANGNHTISAKAYDAAGNTNSDDNSVTVDNGDTEPPSIPLGLSAIASAYNKVDLSWTASTDNVGVTGYWVVRDGVTIANVTSGTAYSDTTVSPSTAYSYQVIASDAAGNLSPPSDIATVTTPSVPDTQAPTVPTGVSATSVSSSQINLSWNASSDNVGVVGYEVYREGSRIATISTTSYGNTGLSPSTTYEYFVKAKDAAGNVSGASNPASATTQAAPQVGTLVGTITNANTGDPVVGAAISVKKVGVKGKKGLVTTATSNGSGVYATTLNPGEYDIEIKKPPSSPILPKP
jgi:chitodextrinase